MESCRAGGVYLAALCGGRRGVESPRGLAQIAVADDVISLEDRARLVARELHRHALRDAAADEVADRGAPQVVGDSARAAGRDDGLPLVLLDRVNPLAVAMEHERHDPPLALESVVLALLCLQHGAKLAGHGEDAALAVLRRAGIETHLARVEVDVAPLKRKDLRCQTPARDGGRAAAVSLLALEVRSDLIRTRHTSGTQGGMLLNRRGPILLKSDIVYCKDDNRPGTYDNISFDFLGYTFQPRRAKNRRGKFFVSFLPAISNKAAKKIRQTIRGWRMASTRNNQTFNDLARLLNPSARGWMNYYGRFYRSRCVSVLRHLNEALAGWVRRKYTRFRRKERKSMHWLWRVSRREPHLFAHWEMGVLPNAEV